jgi:polysaccharide biosynthesis protein PslJ
VRVVARPPLLKPGWIVFALFALNPVWWVMGIGGFVWSMAALPLLIWLLLRKHIVRPPAVALYAIYVGWAALSMVRLDKYTRFLTAGLRLAAYATALMLAYYVYNERRVSRATFVRWIAAFWVAAIAGGYLGLLFPNGRLNMTPASMLLPGAIANNDFIGNLVRPRFAQVQMFLGFPIARPSALFGFTNEWGGNVGLLTPFFVAATLYSDNPRHRRWGVIGLVAALPPMLLSVNRGLWLSMAVILAIVALRSFVLGRTAPLKFFGAAFVVIIGVLVITPIGSLVSGRLSQSDASARAGIYREAWQGALQSPILGWGGPRPSENPFSPAVGTHGHLWFAMFSHGFVGLGLYIAWMVWAMVSARGRRDPVSVMLATVVFVGFVQMFFYKMLPVSIAIILVAIGLLFRDVPISTTKSTERDESGGRPVTADPMVTA